MRCTSLDASLGTPYLPPFTDADFGVGAGLAMPFDNGRTVNDDGEGRVRVFAGGAR